MTHSLFKIITILFIINSFFLRLSRNSFFFFWICIEINIVSFIPIFNKINQTITNSIIKYFIIQSISRNIFLISIIFINYSFFINFFNLILFLSLWIKLGIFPFHNWFFQISENIDWKIWFFLNTFQKIIPIWIINFIFISSNVIFIFIILNRSYSSIEVFNQTSLRWILNSSSLNHFSWLIINTFTNINIWEFYIIIYIFLQFLLFYFNKINNWNTNINFYNNKNTLHSTSFLIIIINFMRIPPFLGFLPKLLTIINSNSLFLIIILLINNIIIILLYLKFSTPIIISNFFKNKIIIKISLLNNPPLLTFLTSSPIIIYIYIYI